jgi:phage terminase small subunit
MPNESQPQATVPKKLTTKQQRFVEEYCVDWNGTQAAIRAGYAEQSAAAEASRLLRNVKVRAAIDQRLQELSLSAGQVTKHISDIAQTRLNDFLTVQEVEEQTRVPQPLGETIALLRKEIAFDEEYATRAADLLKLAGEDREKFLGGKQGALNTKRLQLLRYQMQLEQDATAHILIAGPPTWRKRADLDLVKLAEAKEGNRIKSWQPSEFGIKVEMYDAAAALRDMGRIHGIFEKDNAQSKAVPVLHATVQVLPAAGGVPLAGSEKEVDGV